MQSCGRTPRAFRICRQDQPRRSNSVATVFSAVFFVSRASIAGLLSGFAADEVMDHEAEQVVLVDDVRRKVFGAAPAMRLGDIRVGLAALRPGLYEDLDNTGISALLRASGVQVDTVYVADKPRGGDIPEGREAGVARRVEDGDDRGRGAARRWLGGPRFGGLPGGSAEPRVREISVSMQVRALPGCCLSSRNAARSRSGGACRRRCSDTSPASTTWAPWSSGTS
jgi:hypothetical protein